MGIKENREANKELSELYRVSSILEDALATGEMGNHTTPTLEVFSEKELSPLDIMKEEVNKCTKCSLYQQRNHVVFGAGKTDSPSLMLIGEGPGYNEDRTGIPFIGKAGQYLDKWLTSISLTRDDIYIGNIVKCRPPNNRNPYPEEEEACTGYLIRQIEIIKPKYILCLGKVAGNALSGEQTNMAGLRNKERIYHGVPFIVTFHPAAVLRNPSYRKDVWSDLQVIAKTLNLEVNGRKKKSEIR